MFIRLLFAAVFFMIGGAAYAADSAYSELDFNNGGCKPYGPPPTQEDEDLGVMALKCAGYKGYVVLYNSGDERTRVYFGDKDTDTANRGWESFESFNSIADTVEWRLDDAGKPFAAIVRYKVLAEPSDPDAGKPDDVYGQVLVVYRIGQKDGPEGCAIGLVDAMANKDANVLARKVADEVSKTFACRKDTAIYHGKRGEKAGGFYAYWGE